MAARVLSELSEGGASSLRPDRLRCPHPRLELAVMASLVGAAWWRALVGRCVSSVD
jgi:hypothetical protein